MKIPAPPIWLFIAVFAATLLVALYQEAREPVPAHYSPQHFGSSSAVSFCALVTL
jgi:hypothetical protein